MSAAHRDLWGPLLLCLTLAVTLSATQTTSAHAASVFAAVFVIVWLGAAVVTINATLLGGAISFCHSVCVLGYCVAPLNIASIICCIYNSSLLFVLAVVGTAFVWSTTASVGFMSELLPANKRVLGVYPVCLFYVMIAYMVIQQ